MLLQKYIFFAKQQRCTSQSFKQCGDLFLRFDYESVVCADKKTMRFCNTIAKPHRRFIKY